MMWRKRSGSITVIITNSITKAPQAQQAAASLVGSQVRVFTCRSKGPAAGRRPQAALTPPEHTHPAGWPRPGLDSTGPSSALGGQTGTLFWVLVGVTKGKCILMLRLYFEDTKFFAWDGNIIFCVNMTAPVCTWYMNSSYDQRTVLD